MEGPTAVHMPSSTSTSAGTAAQAAQAAEIATTSNNQAASQSRNASLDKSARQSPSRPDSPHRPSRTRTSKDISTHSPTASQPTSRRPSPHKESSASASVTGDANGPSPYGTRSRNRNVGRVNYAEDHDDQMEFEYTNARKSQDRSVSVAKSQDTEMQKTGSQQGSQQGRRGPAPKTAVAKSVDTPITAHDGTNIPGTSTFSVKDEPVPTAGKKRKAPSTSTPAASAPPPAKRRQSALPTVSSGTQESLMVTFEKSRAKLAADGGLLGDDGIVYRPNDFVYLVCEPPGEPYYIARIMEFLHTDNKPSAPIDALRINWVYRPRDIGRKATDTRVLFASMHSDPCPLTSLRGKCTVKHRSEIDDFEAFRKQKDCFYYSQMYDRYMRRYYEVIPTKSVINVPERVKKALDERWQFVVVEIGRAKELTSAIKACKRCAGYCANSDSVDCAVCKLTYHMQCVQPPLLKKPSRGFGWSCGPCSRKQERRLEARGTGTRGEDDEEEAHEEEEEPAHSSAQRSSSPESVDAKSEQPKATKEQLAQAALWPYRYLGIHCKVEDSVDYDDRIYPRSSSRLGPRHQANVNVWHGRPVEYVKPAEKRRKWGKAAAAKPKPAEDADEPKEKRPKWVLDAPPGYLRRGEDIPNEDPTCTAKTLWKPPPHGEIPERGLEDSPYEGLRGMEDVQKNRVIDEHMAKARKMAPQLGLKDYHTNFLDRALQLLYSHKFDSEAALKELRTTDLKKDLKEPKLTKEELRKFEEGVTKCGSNMTDVIRHVGKPKQYGDIVRFYYTWKKSDRGKQIWGNYEGRKSKKQIAAANAALQDDVADDHDDSAFDHEKAVKKKRGFECKHCGTRHSRRWRRAPGVPPGATVSLDGQKGAKDKVQQLMIALCDRCATLYRKYGLHWEDIEDTARRVAQTGGGRAFKRKQDEEVLVELINANEEAQILMSPVVAQAAAMMGMEIDPALIANPEEIAKKKKLDKALPAPEKEPLPTPPPAPVVVEPPKKKIVEKPPEPPLIPEKPKIKEQPCGVCLYSEPFGDEFYSCRHCHLTVHKRCYGIQDGKAKSKWLCDPCMNDISQQYSTCYECVLCPVRSDPNFELFEAPKPNHKKKTEREREKERLEKILAQEEIAAHKKRQEENGWPLIPREPLKPTANNNWVHVACAVFTSQIKFRNPELLEVVEGSNAIPTQRFEQECKICRIRMGACVTCHKCPNTFHVTCAQMRSFNIGFDITPVKGSRRDTVTAVQMGEESGTAEAIVSCSDHALKSIVHIMTEPLEENKTNALQVFVKHFKQADLSLTGTVRKAAAITSNIRTSTSTGTRSGSLANGITGTTTRGSRVSPDATRGAKDEINGDGPVNAVMEAARKECAICKVESSPRWHEREKISTNSANGAHVNGQKPETEIVCHRCKSLKLTKPPKLTFNDSLPPLPKDGYPPVSTPAQLTPAPTPWQSHPQHPGAYEHRPYDQRPPVPMPAYSHQPQPYANGVHHVATPPGPHPALPRLPTHGSPPVSSYVPTTGPQHGPPPGHAVVPGSQPHSLQHSPMPQYANGYHDRRDMSAPPAQQMPPGPPLRMPPPAPSPHQAPSFATHVTVPAGPPAQHVPHLPAPNQGHPGIERRYSQPPPPSHTSHQSPSFGHSRQPYPPPPVGAAGSPPNHSHLPSPGNRSIRPPSRGRELNGDYRDPTRGPPRSADPFYETTMSPAPTNGASAKPDVKNLIH